MEKVQFQLEATLPELKDLHEKGLFTKNEIDAITRKRTAFETSLARRTTRKEDFFKYAEYEINLERLRKVRWKRLGYHINSPPPSASTYSLPRRALYILKRATAKFPADLATWLAYVEYAGTQNMRKVVLKGLTSALQHHPLSSTLYLLLSYHHLHPDSPLPREIVPSASTSGLPSTSSRDSATSFSLEGTSSARTTLLLGLRSLPQSAKLWMEYIKLELGWVEALRRRWNVLGISDSFDAHRPGGNVAVDDLTGGEGSFGPEGEDARKAILSGHLVFHAIESSLESIKSDSAEGVNFRENLVGMLRVYPSALRTKCLDVVYGEFGKLAESSGQAAARARLTTITKKLYDRPYNPGKSDEGGYVLDGVELVEELGQIGKTIRKGAKKGGPEWLEIAGMWLGRQIERLDRNPDLRAYLFSVLTSLTSPKLHPPPSLLRLHLSLFPTVQNDPEQLLTTARAHAAQCPTNPSIQRIRLEAELASLGHSESWTILESTVKLFSKGELFTEEEGDLRAIWFLWTNLLETSQDLPALSLGSWDTILTLSAKLNSSSNDLHTAVLGRYFISSLQQGSSSQPIELVEKISTKYRPTDDLYLIAFLATEALYEAEPSVSYRVLAKTHEIWKTSSTTPESKQRAGLTWARWLLGNRRAAEASRVVDTLQRELGGSAPHLDAEWRAVLDAVELRREEGIADGPIDGAAKLARRLREVGWGGLEHSTGVSTVATEETAGQVRNDADEDDAMKES